eukprot:TRINITY_DN16828_c0_g1_i1.p1 TRINITY_DN16828_c0_g1~~TRINITY_DN16828_c0_g1_i1.p1  ORF type:complete len:280 (-),score=49.44 TRINITY_DN16828_c0_g1_i1:59-898(-)
MDILEKMKYFLFFVLILFINGLNCDSLFTTFNPEHCRLIDRSMELQNSTYNYIFRGNEPRSSNGDFAYSELYSTFHKIVPSLPENIYIIDVDLLNIYNFEDEKTEKTFFKKNPKLGRYISYPIYGNALIPEWFEEAKLTKLSIDLDNWSHDKIPSFVPYLHKLLNTYNETINQNNTSIVLYIHCNAGMDRTGEVSGSYYIRYLNATFTEALYYDEHDVEQRQIAKLSRNGFQWYCYYLLNTENNLKNVNNCTLPNFDDCKYLNCNSKNLYSTINQKKKR